MDEQKAEEFWQWFVKNESIIKLCITQPDNDSREFVIENLNNHILSFGPLKWDLGLNDANEWFFVISPNCDEQLLTITSELIEMAPTFLDWEFHDNVPAKDWNRQFTLYDHEMEILHVDASNWHYVAFAAGDLVELIIEAPNLNSQQEETIAVAGNLFLMNEIGERLLIERIAKYSLVPELDEEDQEYKYPIGDLKEHIG
jgi:hypothetical protein